MSIDDRELLRTGPQEKRKRRREILVALSAGMLFLILTWVQFRLFGISQKLPFVHSIFFFGLVNFNIILLLFLLFMIFRNVVKVFAEKKGRLIGSSLKSKLIAAFVTFSFVPTLLMFFISVFYINSSFDKWFSIKMAGVLKSALEVTNAYYVDAKKDNYHYASLIAQSIRPAFSNDSIEQLLEQKRREFRLDSVEYYPGVFQKRILAISEDERIPVVPEISL